jgi:hypothetical protein
MRYALLAVFLIACEPPIDVQLDCWPDGLPAVRIAWTNTPDCLQIATEIEGGEIYVTGDVPAPLRCKLTVKRGSKVEATLDKKHEGERRVQH